MSTWWWLRKRTYFVFVMRELSSIFVAWFVVFLLLLLRGVTARARGVRRLPRLGGLALGRRRSTSSAAAFLVLHVVTWFSLTPKAMAISGAAAGRCRRWRSSRAQYAGLAVVSAFVVWLVTR